MGTKKKAVDFSKWSMVNGRYLTDAGTEGRPHPLYTDEETKAGKE